MEIIRTTDPNEFYKYAEYCQEGHEGMVVHICEKSCVWVGPNGGIDEDACIRHGLDIGRGRYSGGGIVNMPGDVSVCITTFLPSKNAYEMIIKAKKEFRERGLNARFNTNDILIDGKKVASFGNSPSFSKMYQSVVHFSVGKMDLDLIKDICVKPMKKIPGSLLDYGITTQDILDLIT